MKNTLVVVADLGGYKAFKLADGELNHTPRLELLDQFDNPEAHGRLVDTVSDLSGRFPRGMAGSAMSDGERHNIELERRKRFVRLLAQRLNQLGRISEFEKWFLAASKEINHQLVAELDSQLRAKITKNVPADLMKVERVEILRHF